MSKIGIKASLQGYDVKRAEASQLSINTDDPTLKVKTGVQPRHFDTVSYYFGSEPAIGTTNLFTIKHGLGYTPFTIAIFTLGDGSFRLMPFRYDIDLGTGAIKTVTAYADATYFYIDLVRVGSANPIIGATFTIKYLISTESGGP